MQKRVYYLIWTIYRDMLVTNFKKIKMDIGSLKDMALWLNIVHLSASREFFAQWFQ